MLNQFKSIFTRSTLPKSNTSTNGTTKDAQIISNSPTGGKLLLLDTLTIRKGLKEVSREVYLFEKGIICLTMKERSNLQSSLGSSFASKPQTPALRSRMKGCILVKSMRRIEDTSTDDELSLTIDVDSKKVDELTLIFKDQRKLERWYSMLSWLSRSSNPPPEFEPSTSTVSRS